MYILSLWSSIQFANNKVQYHQLSTNILKFNPYRFKLFYSLLKILQVEIHLEVMKQSNGKRWFQNLDNLLLSGTGGSCPRVWTRRNSLLLILWLLTFYRSLPTFIQDVCVLQKIIRKKGLFLVHILSYGIK